ncbi:helix-turn-helix transcriptional regulator [Nocardia sp. NPDC005978]|uniref:helix-turn-helix domain-containing protein n=1 Tax=Nocardia sp. NPDC005978 TaxID=3156725 RepID=UPI00339DAFD4
MTDELAEDRERFGERMRALREAAGISGRALARRLGWSQSKVSTIERGRKVPLGPDIRAWCQATGMPLVESDLCAVAANLRTEIHHEQDRLRSEAITAAKPLKGTTERPLQHVREKGQVITAQKPR